MEVASGAVSLVCRFLGGAQGISESFVCTACTTLLFPQPMLLFFTNCLEVEIYHKTQNRLLRGEAVRYDIINNAQALTLLAIVYTQFMRRLDHSVLVFSPTPISIYSL